MMISAALILQAMLLYATICNSVARRLEYEQNAAYGSMSWLKQLQLLRVDIKDCTKLRKQPTTWECFKVHSIRRFDDLMTANEIPIWHGVRLLRNDGAKMQHNSPALLANGRQDIAQLSWFDRLAMSLARTLITHTLQIDLRQFSDVLSDSFEQHETNSTHANQSDPVGTARFRRHRQNMIITMMFGVTALGALLVPIGFQLLSIVSGKALLLAKMALLLASINGLKRVANSGLHYGLYHVPSEQLAGYYDRGDLPHPRQVPNIAVAQPIEFALK